jgi:hypothetical protein
MKIIRYLLIILLPVLVLSQSEERIDTRPVVEKINWQVDNDQGCIMAIENNSICYEEIWMQTPPGGITITSADTDETLMLSNLTAPFWAEVSFYATDNGIYIKSIRFLKQFEYDSEGYIIGEYNEDID